MALNACQRLRIPVVLEPPPQPAASHEPWVGAFLTSTSRLVLPIDSLILGDGTTVGTFVYEPDCIVCRVQAAVADDVVKCSETVEKMT